MVMTTDNCLIGENYRDLRQEKVKQRKAIIKNGKFTLSNFNLFVPNAPFLYALKTSENLSYHVTYAFQGESTLYSCLNVKELLARSRHIT